MMDSPNRLNDNSVVAGNEDVSILEAFFVSQRERGHFKSSKINFYSRKNIIRRHCVPFIFPFKRYLVNTVDKSGLYIQASVDFYRQFCSDCKLLSVTGLSYKPKLQALHLFVDSSNLTCLMKFIHIHKIKSTRI
jgi:hypothetical protein